MMKHRQETPKSSAIEYVLAVFMGTVIGGILGGFVLPGIYYSFVNPDVLKDGQYGLIYLSSVPLGALIGAVLGIAFLCFTTAKMHAGD